MAETLLYFTSMNSGLRLLLILTAGLTFMVGLSNAYAGPSCARVLVIAREQTAFTVLRELINHSVVSKEDAPEFKPWLEKLEKLSEAYFEIAGITYEKSHTLVNMTWGEQQLFRVEAPRYKILAGSQIDSNGRLIEGFFLKANDPSVRLIFNPLQKFLHGTKVGEFDERTNTITFSIRGLWDKDMNFDNLLRHEMAHYFEQKKLNAGKFTLARFELRQNKADPKEPYALGVRLDELETHLRDLRSIRDLSENKIQFYREIPVKESTLAEYSEMRIKQRAYKLKNIERIGTRALEAFVEARKNLRLAGFEKQPNGETEVAILLRNGHYGMLELTLPPQKPGATEKSVEAQFNEIVELAEARIHQILKEARKLPK